MSICSYHVQPARVALAPVQGDRAGAALVELRRELSDFVGSRPITEQELQAARTIAIGKLTAGFALPDDVLEAAEDDRILGRPADDRARLAGAYRAVTLAQARDAVRTIIRPDQFVWVIAGDAASIRPQLAEVGLPILRTVASSDR